MQNHKSYRNKTLRWPFILVAAFLFGILVQSEGRAFVIHVLDDNDQPIKTGFRYLIEEDSSFYTVPGRGTPTANYRNAPGAANPSHTLGVNIHRSHAPVVCTGDTGATSGISFVDVSTNPDCVINPEKRYIVSVIPWHKNPGFPVGTSTPGPPTASPPWFSDQAGFGMSGESVAGDEANVRIVVHKFPIPTAQITVLVFQDNQPINAAYDQPAEAGLPGFNIHLTDIVGKMM